MNTPDSHDFPTRSYDLVKEFVIALIAVTILTGGWALIFYSPDEMSITMPGCAPTTPNE